tara:strand:- start:499 stop:813 length:315 start_codon:yes stop_codon:yes gene_type:complete
MQRDDRIIIRVSKQEKEKLMLRSQEIGASLSEYVRGVLLANDHTDTSSTLTCYERDVLGLVMNSTMLLRKLSVSMGHDGFIKEVKDWSDTWISEHYDMVERESR